AAFTRDKNTQVVLRADAGVSHGRVVGVMERAKRVGLSRLAIATAGGG
ncbi:MAG: biopolymer transporter ExbD, partial [Kofleriaceae bacterium]|nr:biopolymer transporter ExbD [Kofleriaceae bacterium]